MKGFLSLTVLPLLAAASPVAVGSIHNDAAPILSSMTSRDIPDSYIIVFKKHVDQSSASAHQSWLQEVHTAHTGRMELKKRSLFDFDFEGFMGLKHTFQIAGSLTGYAGHFHEDVIEQIRRHPDVSIPIPSLRKFPRPAANMTQNRLTTLRRTPRSVL